MTSSASAPSVTPAELTRRIGSTNERALAYVHAPDPALSRLPRKAREQLITEVPPVTAGALLGPAALARHFVASAASGRYQDLFGLWELFTQRPDDCRPVLAERPEALERARSRLRSATELGLAGHAERVASDVTRARGLIWQWLREVLDEHLDAVAQRPAVASALLFRDPSVDLSLPDPPDARWLAEAAQARTDGPLAEPVERLLHAHVEQLPPTIPTLSLVHEVAPEALDAMLARVDLDRPDIDALLAWARDHGGAGALRARIVGQLEALTDSDPAAALDAWWRWRRRGVDATLPSGVVAAPIDVFDLTRPDTAELLAHHVASGRDPRAAERLAQLAASNRQLGEKAYEAMVCAGLDVSLPSALEDNPVVKDGTRCPACGAWTWVRPGHEDRCPRLATAAPSAESSASAPPEPATTPSPQPSETASPQPSATSLPEPSATSTAES